MIESYVGADTFRKGVNAYLQAHAYGNATSEDFAKAIAATSGKPVERILPTFVNQPGVPLLDVALACAGRPHHGHAEAAALLRRRAAERRSGPLADSVLREGAGPGVADLRGHDRRDAHADSCPARCVPWVFANAGARGYYRTAYPSEMLRALAPHVETELTAPERLVLLDDEWALVRAGRQTAGDYLTLASGYGREHVSGVLEEVARRLDTIDDDLTTIADEAEVRRRSRARCSDRCSTRSGFTASRAATTTIGGRCAAC